MAGASNSPRRTSGSGRWPLRIASDSRHGVHVLTLTGRLGHESAPRLAAAVSEAFSASRAVVIDCAGVDYVSSACLPVIERMSNGASPGALVLANVVEAVRISLDLAGLGTRLAIEPSLDLAITRAARYL